MAYRRHSFRGCRPVGRRTVGRRPRSYRAFFKRKRRKVSFKTPFNSYGGIVR